MLVEGRRVTDPAVVAWMTRYQARILKKLRFDSRRGCGRSDICPAFSLPDLFTTKASLVLARPGRGRCSTPCRAYFSQSVITPDRRTATLAFGLKLMPLERQYDVLRTMQRELDPPAGRDGAARRAAGARGARPTTGSRRRGAGWRRCWPACWRSPSCCSRRCAARVARSCR